MLTQQPPSPEEMRRETRRRLLKAGLLSVPVVLTVRSRPVLAQSLGSAGINYGAYFQAENGELIPVRCDDWGRPIDANGNVINPNDSNAKTRYQFMEDPTRRTEGTYSWNDYNKRNKK